MTFRSKIVSQLAAFLLVLGAVSFSPPSTQPAIAGGAMAVAAEVANQGLAACSNSTGKTLYSCVADVFDSLANRISSIDQPAALAAGALRSAAAKLRNASNKAQALSALAACRAVFNAAFQQAKAAGGGGGISAIAVTLAKATQLIQTKG